MSLVRNITFPLFFFLFFGASTLLYTPDTYAQSPGDISPAAEASRQAEWVKRNCPEGTIYSPTADKCVLQFTPLVGLPFVDTTDPDTDLGTYVNALYLAAISIGAFLAVVKIIFAGVKYMLSDVITDKGDAKKDIRGALIGLLIVVGAVLILNTINPQLTGLNALNKIEGINVDTWVTKISNQITAGESINTNSWGLAKIDIGELTESCKQAGGTLDTISIGIEEVRIDCVPGLGTEINNGELGQEIEHRLRADGEWIKIIETYDMEAFYVLDPGADRTNMREEWNIRCGDWSIDRIMINKIQYYFCVEKR